MNTVLSPRTIGVCGVGQIGASLSLLCWRSGYRVLMYDQDPSKLEKARQTVEEIDASVAREFPELKANYGELESILDLPSLDQDAELVLECIQEDLTAKVVLFQNLSGAASRGAVLCSCTSGLSVSAIGAGSGHPQQLAGTHFWSPPHLMPLVEVIRGRETSEEVLQTALAFCRSIGKRAVRVNHDEPGFIGNRMLHALWREAIAIVERGIASPEDVDLVARCTIGLKLPALGPLEHMDLAGLDLIHSIHEYLLADLAANDRPNKLLSKLVQEGKLGAKSGAGFYDWRRRNSKAIIQARDRQIIRELRGAGRENG